MGFKISLPFYQLKNNVFFVWLVGFVFWFYCCFIFSVCENFLTAKIYFPQAKFFLYGNHCTSSLTSLYLGYICSWLYRILFDSKACISTALIEFLWHQTLSLIKGIIYTVLGRRISSSNSAGFLEQIQHFSPSTWTCTHFSFCFL